MSTSLSPTERTRVRRQPERARSDRADLYAVLDEALVCHLGVVVDGYPAVLPTLCARADDTLYIHGSSGSRTIRAAADSPVCVTVTHLDGLVLARSVFHHSANYRSAVIYGVTRLIADSEEKLAGLRAVTEHLAPGQWDAARRPNRKELAATSVLALPLGEASVKVRSGPPGDEPEDMVRDTWSGVLPARMVWGEPVPDPTLRPGTPLPEHVRDLVSARNRRRPAGADRAADVPEPA